MSQTRRFQSTHPMRGATQYMAYMATEYAFQSTHLMRGATLLRLRNLPRSLFQSTHLMRGATTGNNGDTCMRGISIHAPHTGCDAALCSGWRSMRYFNPRTPCGVRPSIGGLVRTISYFNPRTPCGVRHWLTNWLYPAQLFQSTHPMRGATGVL